MSQAGDRLYQLLPAIYRQRDAAQGEPLRALLEVIAAQVEALRENLDDLYDDWFIETCADWVVPYLGDLVGNRPLQEVTQLRRTDVAKTISYRRRKGTLAMLEELANDVTGWGAHAVEFFQLLGWTQNLNHRHWQPAPDPGRLHPSAMHRVGTVNVRSAGAMDRLHGPFEVSSHTVAVRSLERGGRYNIPRIGFFLWRLQHYPLTGVSPRASASHPYGYHVSPLGNPAPLFQPPRPNAELPELADELKVAGPIRPWALYEDLEAYRRANSGLPPGKRAPQSEFYGPDRSLRLLTDGRAVPPLNIICKDLENWDRPPAGKVAVDVRRGRLTFAAGEEPESVRVDYHYGFSGDLGGGPYGRRATLAELRPGTLILKVAQGTSLDTIGKALQQWSPARPPCVIYILDNATYEESLDLDLPDQGFLALEAADGVRPHLRLAARGTLAAPAAGATLIINGLLVEGGLALSGNLDLTLRHCTLVPGGGLSEAGEPADPDWDSLIAPAAGDGMTVTLERCLSGPVRLPATITAFRVSQSLIQGLPAHGSWRSALAGTAPGEPGPPTELEQTTILGPLQVRELTASESICTGLVQVERRQTGCLRFSYAPPGSLTPRRYRCQPDLALSRRARDLGLEDMADLPLPERNLILARLKPDFTSERYGDPGYAQLSLRCPLEITTGSENGAEMGAFQFLQQPQRAANLRLRLDEYLPFGLEAGLIYVT